MKAEEHMQAERIQVKVNRKYIWPSGELGELVIEQKVFRKTHTVKLTLDQARSLIEVIKARLGDKDESTCS